MNRTTTILLLLFLFLGLGAWFYQNESAGKKTSLSNNDWEMAIEDIDAIHRVFVADRNSNTTNLVRKKDYWLYNDKYKARPNAVEVVLDAIRRVRLKNRPSNAAIEPMIKSIASQGIKVEIYDKEGNNMKTYYIGGVTPDERGTYMIMEGSENPYVMYIPNWDGSIRGRFFFGDKNWRDKTVFAERVEDIEAVSVEYPKKKNLSFKLRKNGNTYNVQPFYETTTATNKEVNPSAVEKYLMGFESLGAEAFENENPFRDSISAQLPFSIVTLENNKGESKTLRIHPLRQRGEDGKPLPKTKVDRYLADCSTGDFYLIQHVVFGKTLWAYDYFFENK